MESSEKKTINKQVVGTWELDEIYFKFEDGSKIDMFGESPVGILMYDNVGFMNAQLGSKDHKHFYNNNDAKQLNSDNLFGSYMAYYGKYYEEAPGQLVHEVIGCVNPEWIGEKEIRYFEVKGDNLRIWTPEQNINNKMATVEVLWKRKY